MNDETAREKLARTLGEAWITSGPRAWEEQSEGRRAGARHLADALLPVVREIAAEELRGAAAAHESDAEQPHLNYLADHVYRPGDCLSSIWLRARADALHAEAAS